MTTAAAQAARHADFIEAAAWRDMYAAARIGAAISAGCTSIVTETGEPVHDEPNPSLANMARCGFSRVASRLNWESPG